MTDKDAAIERLTRERDEFRASLATQCGKTLAAEAELARAREALAKVSDPATVGGMLFEDRDKCLQAIARAVLAAKPEDTA